MAPSLYQDPEPSEAKGRKQGLTQQAVQGKDLSHFKVFGRKIKHWQFNAASSTGQCFSLALFVLPGSIFST